MQRYRKKPDIVDAIQLRWETWDEVVQFVGMKGISPLNFAYHILAEEATDTCGEDGPDYLAFIVMNAEGESNTVRHGDWVINDRKPGTFFKLSPDEFAVKYESMEE